jgi:uncharacterized RDD family membrane protein YckC
LEAGSLTGDQPPTAVRLDGPATPEPEPEPPTSPTFVLGDGRDPTAVMGRRIGAYLLDGLLVLLFTMLAVLAGDGITERPELTSCAFQSGVCVDLGDGVYTVAWSSTWVLYVVPLLYALLLSCLVQGVTGATPGKFAFGLRVVDPAGGRPGVGRAFVRTLFLVVDNIGCGLPLVGLITALASTGHRRVGDMVARTFVVDRHDTGRSIELPPTPRSATSPPPSPSPPPPPRPQWDPARQAYVLWDPARQRWLVHDPARQQWTDL